MPRGRQSDGEYPLSNAERQARYRARCRAAEPPRIISSRQHANRSSRPQRWRAAVAELVALQTEYAAWLEGLPPSLQDTATAVALLAIVDLDLDTLANTEPPRGYGRD